MCVLENFCFFSCVYQKKAVILRSRMNETRKIENNPIKNNKYETT